MRKRREKAERAKKHAECLREKKRKRKEDQVSSACQEKEEASVVVMCVFGFGFGIKFDIEKTHEPPTQKGVRAEKPYTLDTSQESNGKITSVQVEAVKG